MGQPRPTYTAAFRDQIVALHRSGRIITELADEFQRPVWTIRYWIRQACRDGVWEKAHEWQHDYNHRRPHE